MSTMPELDGLFLRVAANQVGQACHDAAKSWWIDAETGEDVRNWPTKFFKLWVSSKLMLCVCEAAEGMEGHRKGLMDDHLPQYPMLGVELADMIIRGFDLSVGLGFDIGKIIEDKLAYNAQRADHKPEARAAAGGKSI